MQYTGSSFGLAFASLAAPLVRLRTHRGEVSGIAPGPTRLSCTPEETLLERLVLPGLGAAGLCCRYLRRMQHGEVQVYILYIFATLMTLLLWVH